MGTKKYSKSYVFYSFLFLVHPYVAVTNHRDAHFTINGVVEDQVLLVGNDFIHSYISPK